MNEHAEIWTCGECYKFFKCTDAAEAEECDSECFMPANKYKAFPDLLEACKEVVSWWNQLSDYEGFENEKGVCILDAMKQAIEKAEGNRK